MCRPNSNYGSCFLHLENRGFKVLHSEIFDGLLSKSYWYAKTHWSTKRSSKGGIKNWKAGVSAVELLTWQCADKAEQIKQVYVLVDFDIKYLQTYPVFMLWNSISKQHGSITLKKYCV